MVGEYSGDSSMIRDILPTIFSYLAACFVNEEMESKLQILICITKIVVQSWRTLGASFKTAVLALTYILDLGICDGNYDVRDRARMLKQLMDLHRKVIASDDLEASDLINKLSLAKGHIFDAGSTSLNEQETSKKTSIHTLRMLPDHVLTFSKLTSRSMSTSQDRTFLPGSMSHVVNHRTPGYRPLPEPCSFEALDVPVGDVTSISEHPSNNLLKLRQERSEDLGEESDFSDSYSSGVSISDGDDDGNTVMLVNANNGLVDSHASETGSVSSNGASKSDRSFHSNSGSTLDQDTAVEPLICLSDNEVEINFETSALRLEQADSQQSPRTGLSLRSSEDLESWLASDSLGNIKQLSEELRMPSGYLNLSMDSIKREPRKITLLDFTNGEGLEVKYCFGFGNAAYHEKMVWVKLYFANRSSDALSAIHVKEWELGAESGTIKDFVKPGGLVVSSPEVNTLEPHQAIEFDLHVDFQQQLVPVKLAVHCNQKCFPVKLVPDIGAFLRPKELTSNEFTSAELRLVGMFETTCRCSVERALRSQNLAVLDADEEALALARVLATRVLSQVNVFLVMARIPVFPGAINDDVWNVHLKFSGETLRDSSLCLITITLQPQSASDSTNILPVLVKVNCEDSVFGLNLLNRLQKAVTEKQ
eukprot:c24672_g1_i2 orf=84-2030(-)